MERASSHPDPEDPTESLIFPPNPEDTLDADPAASDSARTRSMSAGDWADALRRMSESHLQTPASAPGTPASITHEPERRYLFRRRIGRGGNGEVWEALQVTLDRVIAVKRLRDDPDTGQDTPITKEQWRLLEYCFRQEALTTAHLEHPNIVPVYDLGMDEAGRPLLAMKRVSGRQWQEVIRDEFSRTPPPEFLARHLPILISVAQAAAFAHSRGILHRDLKPTQVMIGAYGETLVMDWGLATAFSSPDSADGPHPFDPRAHPLLFVPMNPAGTPAYMAPEQTDRDTARLGPWTDVYLLGGILYYLLTGASPRSGMTSEDAFLAAWAGKYHPLEESAQGREIPPQLASLIERAMEPDPGRRIRRAEEFLAALQDYLTGADKRRESARLTRDVEAILDVEGRADYATLADALNRLERCLALWPENRQAAQRREEVLLRYARAAIASQDLKLARVQAERLAPTAERESLLAEIAVLEEAQRRQQERLAEALREAREGRERAEAARQRADAMRARAEELVRFLLGDLHRDLKPVGRLDTLRRVTQTSLDYFDSLPPEEATAQTLHNRAIAYLNIADVFSDEGKKPEAAEAYRKARDLARALTGKDPRRAEWLLTLAASHDGYGLISYYQGRAEEALREYEIALAIREQVAAAKPEDPSVRSAIASSLHRMAIVRWRRQELDRSLELHSKALAISRALLAADPENEDLRSEYAHALSTVGNVYRDLGDLERAIEVTREGLEIREELARRQPANRQRAESLLWSSGNLALLLLMRCDYEGAMERFASDLPLRRRLCGEDPENIVRQGALTFSLSLLGEIYFGFGRLEDAEPLVRECLEINERMFRRDPTSTYVLGGYARATAQLAEVWIAQGRWEEAAPLLETARARAREASSRAPQNGTLAKNLTVVLNLLGRLKRRQGLVREAEALWSEALAKVRELKITGDEVDILDIQAQALLALGRRDEAAPFLEALRARRWITPSLKGVARELGCEIP